MESPTCCRPSVCLCSIDPFYLAPCPPWDVGYTDFVDIATQQNLTASDIEKLLNLCGIREPEHVEPPESKEKTKGGSRTGLVVGLVSSLVLVLTSITLLLVLYFYRRRKWMRKPTETSSGCNNQAYETMDCDDWDSSTTASRKTSVDANAVAENDKVSEVHNQENTTTGRQNTGFAHEETELDLQERESPIKSAGQETLDGDRVDIPDTCNITSVGFTNGKSVDNNKLAGDTKDLRTPQVHVDGLCRVYLVDRRTSTTAMRSNSTQHLCSCSVGTTVANPLPCAPCPPWNVRYMEFWELASSLNLTDCEIENISRRCDISIDTTTAWTYTSSVTSDPHTTVTSDSHTSVTSVSASTTGTTSGSSSPAVTRASQPSSSWTSSSEISVSNTKPKWVTVTLHPTLPVTRIAPSKTSSQASAVGAVVAFFAVLLVVALIVLVIVFWRRKRRSVRLVQGFCKRKTFSFCPSICQQTDLHSDSPDYGKPAKINQPMYRNDAFEPETGWSQRTEFDSGVTPVEDTDTNVKRASKSKTHVVDERDSSNSSYSNYRGSDGNVGGRGGNQEKLNLSQHKLADRDSSVSDRKISDNISAKSVDTHETQAFLEHTDKTMEEDDTESKVGNYSAHQNEAFEKEADCSQRTEFDSSVTPLEDTGTHAKRASRNSTHVVDECDSSNTNYRGSDGNVSVRGSSQEKLNLQQHKLADRNSSAAERKITDDSISAKSIDAHEYQAILEGHTGKRKADTDIDIIRDDPVNPGVADSSAGSPTCDETIDQDVTPATETIEQDGTQMTHL